MDVEAINQFLQTELRRRQRDSVPAVEAARWLDGAGLLRDSEQRRGRPLRDLLRAGQITGQRQGPTADGSLIGFRAASTEEGQR